MRHYPPKPTARTHNGWSPHRDRALQNKFRLALIQRAGGRCENVLPADGINWSKPHRCGSTVKLQAHHDVPGRYDPDAGRLLCWDCHKLEDPHAR